METETLPPHPVQPTYTDDYGTVRFRRNRIVRFLLDASPFDMNTLALMPFSREDRAQFAQLIGYSVGGYEDLPYADDMTEAANPEPPREPLTRRFAWDDTDPAGAALSVCRKLLDELPPADQRALVAYLQERYGKADEPPNFFERFGS